MPGLLMLVRVRMSHAQATPTVSSPPSSPPSSPEKGGNNLWILGPILGPLGCLCGLIGGICYYQKKKKAKVGSPAKNEYTCNPDRKLNAPYLRPRTVEGL